MRDGVPITELVTPHAVSTGITYGIRIPGMVADYEEAEAMAARKMTEGEWQALPWDERARYIAHDRIARYVDLHTGAAVAEAQRRASKRKGG